MATALLLYWLKANAVLLGVAAAYFGLLRRLTFFTLNRAYLLLGLLFAAAYPVLPVPALLPAPVLVLAAGAPLAAAAPGPVAPAGPDWSAWLLGLYGLGCGGLLLRLLGQLLALARLHLRSRPGRVLGQAVRVLPGPGGPFSFGRHIYLDPARHSAAELSAVLRHERVHVRQGHTLDVLLAQVAVALAWPNPAVWLLRRAILDNLEYLADEAVLHAGLDRRRYQYSLLQLSRDDAAPALVSHFAYSTLKNRVAMMNAPLSPRRHLLRYLLAGPALLTAALGVAAARAQAPVVAVVAAPTAAPDRPALAAPAAVPGLALPAPTTAPPLAHRPISPKHRAKQVHPARPADLARPTPPAPAGPVVYYVDGQRVADATATLQPSDVASVHVLKGESARPLLSDPTASGVVLITTKLHQNDASVQAFNRRYGVAVATPTPVPAAPAALSSVPYLAPAALVHITKNYPGARLMEVSDVTAADGSTQHRALVAVGRRPVYLLFDDQGSFLAEQPYAPQAQPATGSKP